MNDLIHLFLGGDVMLGRGVNRTVAGEGIQYPFNPLLPLLNSADLLFVNLECAITSKNLEFSGAPKKFYFRSGPAGVDVLEHAGVDLVSMANNHALDADTEGLLDTLEHLDSRKIAHAGAGRNLREAMSTARVPFNGTTFGVLSCCDHQANFAATADQPGIWYVNMSDSSSRESLVNEVSKASKQVDHLVVALHWMHNYVPSVKKRYRALAGDLINAGARILWGHSPHHILGTEWFENGVALYSTGDLLDDYAVDSHYRNDRQLLYEIRLDKNEVKQILAHPVKLEFSRTRPANEKTVAWIREWLRTKSMEVGSTIQEQNGSFEIKPQIKQRDPD